MRKSPIYEPRRTCQRCRIVFESPVDHGVHVSMCSEPLTSFRACGRCNNRVFVGQVCPNDGWIAQ